jgi:hypothetical protein
MARPRPLKPAGAAMLSHASGYATKSEAALRAQAETAMVVGKCGCGCASIDLEVDPATPDAEDQVLDLFNPGPPPQGVLVFVRESRLAGLEIFNYDPTPNPKEFPPPSGFGPEGPRTSTHQE